MSKLPYLHWPAGVLPPSASPFNLRPFTRSGGRTLGGIERSSRTDRGYWLGSYEGVLFRKATQPQQERVWQALRVGLGGRAGLVVVPICATRSWAAPGFTRFASVETTHDDDTTFDDGSSYTQGVIAIEAAADAAIGATTMTLELIHAPTASGIRFSYQHALYETGRILAEPGADQYTVEVFPAVRAPIPAGALLQADRPTCLCRLASDGELDLMAPPGESPRPSVAFVEAVDWWNALALGQV